MDQKKGTKKTSLRCSTGEVFQVSESAANRCGLLQTLIQECGDEENKCFTLPYSAMSLERITEFLRISDSSLDAIRLPTPLPTPRIEQLLPPTIAEFWNRYIRPWTSDAVGVVQLLQLIKDVHAMDMPEFEQVLCAQIVAIVKCGLPLEIGCASGRTASHEPI